MKKILIPGLMLTALTVTWIWLQNQDEKEALNKPNDWFFRQRAFPYAEINYEARTLAWEQALAKKAEADTRNIGWILDGPLNVGGRISALASPPDDAQTIYAGVASGGVFKTTNGGSTWNPVFDDALSLSIGDIALAPSDPDIIYVGTGESNAGGGSLAYDGFGIYRSSDGGQNWDHLGLENCGSVGRIAIHPLEPQTAFVAAMGRLFSNNPERGIFRTVNGGESWEKVLYVSDSTGGIDIVMDPLHPDTLYAALWERIRRPEMRSYGGPTCGVFRSFDGGDTWTELTVGLPSPSHNVGRIGIDISASSPNILYAIYADRIGYFDGVYKTTDHGETWTQTNDAGLNNMYSSFGWWFGRISIDPADPDKVYAIGLDLYKTTNGGNSWFNTSGSVHVDQHDLIAHATNPDFVILGNDGGVYLSYNGGSSWSHLNNMPITQFYTCEVDYQFPERLYGGTQDNGTNRTMTGSLDDWQHIYWGDGFYVRVDPSDNSYVYAEYQYGNFARSTNGGYSFNSAMNGINGSDRKNWNTPFALNPVNPEILYYGSDKLYKTLNRASSWFPVSPDLTNGFGGGNLMYGTLTTIAVAPSNTDYIYVGTDDGNVWVSPDDGSNWNNISSSFPLRWVTRVAVDPYDEEVAYVTLSGYRYDSYQPHIFRTADAGLSWQDISGDMPEAPVNDIIIDPDFDSTLYVATDFGVYVSWNLGVNWHLLGSNLPNAPVVDLTLHAPTRKLIAATYGRSMYSFLLDQLVDIHHVKDPAHERSFIFPNPATEKLTVVSRQLVKEVTIYDGFGRKVKEVGDPENAHTFEINIAELQNGMYVLVLSGDNGIIGTEKFLKIDD